MTNNEHSDQSDVPMEPDLCASVFFSYPDVLLLLDAAGRILHMNHQAQSVLGEDLHTSSSNWWLQRTHPDERTLALRHFLRARDGLTQRFECRIFNHEGNRLDVEITLISISSDFLDQGVFVSARDITSEKELHQTLLTSQEALKKSEKLATLGELAAGIAHEIRNPLTTLKGFIQLLNEGHTGGAQPYADIMYSELTRIETVVSELVLLARPQVQSYCVLDLRSAIKDALQSQHTQAALQHVKFTAALPQEELLVWGDSQQLQIVVSNIVQNALEAMPSGGVVRVAAVHTSSSVQITISDNGPGIPPERLEQIGEPFYSTKDRGAGLGLMISQRILEFHGGTLQIQSEVDEGTVVVINLPNDLPQDN